MKRDISPRLSAVLATLCVCGAMALYVPWDALGSSEVLIGLDRPLHASRIDFVRDAVAETSAIPEWSPREFLGAPFSANLHSFPLIPTRLFVLVIGGAHPYLVGVLLAAGLAALFTWLLARELGLSPVGATFAGWTFAAAGFFSSRVLAGHLTLLEAYPALPLLLWLAIRSRRMRGTPTEWVLLGAVAIATGAVVLAGHPQLPTYAIAATGAFMLLHGDRRQALRPIAGMLFGIGLSLFAWLPMLQLVGRSTRILDLMRADNDLFLPWGRLAAMVAPGIDGYPVGHPLYAAAPFQGYPNAAYFWDTIGYVGILPLLVVLGLAVHHLVRRRRPTGPLAALAAVSIIAGLFALPWAAWLLDAIPGTLLRSPSRLIYIVTLGLAVGLGWCADRIVSQSTTARWVAVAALAAVHVLDLGGFARTFVVSDEVPSMPSSALQAITDDPDHRAAVDRWLGYPEVADIDDVSIFDSVLLADTYQAMLSLSRIPAETNMQYLDGSALDVVALRRAAVSHVLTHVDRDDLPIVEHFENVTLYRVPEPLPRVSFHGSDAVVFVEDPADLVPAPEAPLDVVRLPAGAAEEVPPSASSTPGNVRYARGNDVITIDVESPGGGWVRVVESWDPGWSATIDGVTARVWRADGFVMGLAVPAGEHKVVLDYRTPGRLSGLAGSGLSMVGLAWFLGRVRRQHGQGFSGRHAERLDSRP